MKLDIEGSEVEVVEDLIMQGSLQYLDVMMVEFHTWMAKGKKKHALKKYAQFILKSPNEFALKTGIEYLNEIRN